MNKVLKIFILCLLFFPATTWGQSHLVPGTAVEEPLKKHHHDRPVNFGIKGGFTSSLFLVSNLTLNGITIDEVQNNYKIGYFGSVFMRINFERHFLQPEISYNINRCNITFEKPAAEDAPLEMASITSEIHSVDIMLLRRGLIVWLYSAVLNFVISGIKRAKLLLRISTSRESKKGCVR